MCTTSFELHQRSVYESDGGNALGRTQACSQSWVASVMTWAILFWRGMAEAKLPRTAEAAKRVLIWTIVKVKKVKKRNKKYICVK